MTDADGTDGSDDAARPRVIAHRGFAGAAPENTVGAVRFAADAGAELVEVDVRPTSDREVVVFHDDHLSGRDGDTGGLTDRSGLVHETPWATVRDAEVLRSGETVPRLADVFEALPADVGVNVELKHPETDDLRFGEKLSGAAFTAASDRWHSFVADVVAITEGYDHEVLFSSFYEGALAAIHEIAPETPTAALCADDVETGLAIAREYDCVALHPPADALLDGRLDGDRSGEADARPELLRVAHGEGRAVNVYTVQTWETARTLATLGVDGVIADYPGLFAFEERKTGVDP
jgi:glycerophosphoryl diester phosphodiesterase